MNVCIYHKADLDGMCSGAIWRQFSNAPEDAMIPMNYGDDIPWDKLRGRDVTIVDFTLQPWSQMERLLDEAQKVTWIDHHKSTIDAWVAAGAPHIYGRREIGKAACELCWEYYSDATMPDAVRLLGRYDVWDHADIEVLPFQMGMRLYDADPRSDIAMSLWTSLFYGDGFRIEAIIRNGQAILECQSRENARAIKAIWFPIEFDGKRWMAANRGGVNSKFWDAVWDDSFDGRLGFCWSRKHWTVTMYSDTVDCGEIAARYGGGGHKGAAGFQCETLPFSPLQDSAS